MTAPRPDKRVVACNVGRASSSIAEGAHAYVRWYTGDDRVPILARSRGGRYIEAWRYKRELVPFRAASIPPESPIYRRIVDQGEDAQRLADRLNTDARREEHIDARG